MHLNRHERGVLRALAADLHDCPGELAHRLAPPCRWWEQAVRALVLLAPFGCGPAWREWPPAGVSRADAR